MIQIDYKWPNNKYALLAPDRNKCPNGWSAGYRTQGVGGKVGFSSGITGRIGVNFKASAKTITQHYCVKDMKKGDGGAGFEWPKGSYCIARRGKQCPERAFEKGSITWDDKELFLRSRNADWGKLPDGEYNRNTKVEFCCRSNMPPMMLPVAEPVILYQYGPQCQTIAGMKLDMDFIKFDSNGGLYSKNGCTGKHPGDEKCKGDHILYLCYYKRISL